MICRVTGRKRHQEREYRPSTGLLPREGRTEASGRSFAQVLHEGSTVEILGPSSTAFLGLLAGDWIESGAAGSQTIWVGCQGCRQQLPLVCHDTDPPVVFNNHIKWISDKFHSLQRLDQFRFIFPLVSDAVRVELSYLLFLLAVQWCSADLLVYSSCGGNIVPCHCCFVY